LAATLPLLFRHGDYLGNLKILELKRLLRTSTIYKAKPGIRREFFRRHAVQLGLREETSPTTKQFFPHLRNA